jgi:NAD(P)H dehydrogenase (quinone)
MIYAVAGITGKVGAAVARNLLAQGRRVRAVVRDKRKAQPWIDLGCETAEADLTDADALALAFADVEGAFVLVPANFAPSADFSEARAAAAAIAQALGSAAVPKVLALSSVGSHQSSGLGLITQTRLLEEALASFAGTLVVLRPAWFFENAAWDIDSASQTGVMPSFLQPLDRHLPMVATADIGRIAAMLLLDSPPGRRTVELEGPRRCSPNDIASGLAAALGRDVHAEIVPRRDWDTLFKAQGTADPSARIDMLDGLNSGWIDFESPTGVLKGDIELATVLQELVAAHRSAGA